MPESKIVYVSNDIPVGARIHEVKTQISEWIQSLDRPFRQGNDTMSLTKCRHDDQSYSLRYEIQLGAMPPGKPWADEK